MNTFISLDLETTGLSPVNSEILQVAGWKIKDGVVAERFNQFVKPVRYITTNIQNITGITPDMVADANGVDMVLCEFADFCEDLPLLGYNLPFDYKFICDIGSSFGIDFTMKKMRQGIDVLSLCRHNYKLESYKLQDVADYLGIKLTGQAGYHKADFDSYITKLVYDRLRIDFGTKFEVSTPSYLHKDDKKYGKVENNDELSFT